MKSTLKKLINKLKKIRVSSKRKCMNWKQQRQEKGFNVEVKSYGIDKETREFRAQIMVGDINYLTNYYFTANEGSDAQKLDRCIVQAVKDFLEEPTNQQELPIVEEKKDEESKPRKERKAKAEKNKAEPKEETPTPVVEKEVSKAAEVKQESPKVEESPKKVETKVEGAYDRTVHAHTQKLLAWMNKDLPQWKADPKAREKVGAASTKLNGKSFLDVKGEILDSFKAEFLKETGFPTKK